MSKNRFIFNCNIRRKYKYFIFSWLTAYVLFGRTAQTAGKERTLSESDQPLCHSTARLPVSWRGAVVGREKCYCRAGLWGLRNLFIWWQTWISGTAGSAWTEESDCTGYTESNFIKTGWRYRGTCGAHRNRRNCKKYQRGFAIRTGWRYATFWNCCSDQTQWRGNRHHWFRTSGWSLLPWWRSRYSHNYRFNDRVQIDAVDVQWAVKRVPARIGRFSESKDNWTSKNSVGSGRTKEPFKY